MRIYDGKYLSVTSIVGLRNPFNKAGFESWCQKVGKDPALIASTSRILGQKVSEYLNDVSDDCRYLVAPPVDDLEGSLYHAIEEFLKEWELVDTEQVVKCEELNYAGRYDGMIKNKKTGKSILADWKTFGAWNGKEYKRDSNKIKHTRWQLTMYANAMGWKDKLAVVVFKNDGSWELEEVEYDEEMIQWIVDNKDLILETIENENKKSNKKM